MAKPSKQKSPAETAVELVIPETIEIRLEGKDWPIVMSPRVLMIAEKATGLNLLVDLGTFLLKPTMEFVCGVLYGCLKVAGAPYTFDQVCDLVTPKLLPLVSKGVVMAGLKLSQALIEEMEENPTNGVPTND